jgi:predicted anti-sigma-YlaC factor YlaD
MTCAEFNVRYPAWLAGTLSDVDARAVEQHAAECVECGARLDASSRLGALSPEIAPPAELRAVTLRAVAQRRAAVRWRRTASAIAALAAVAILVVVEWPRNRPASESPVPGREVLAVARARPELAALDAAERDVERALRAAPADSSLASDLVRIRRQRDAMQRLVAEATQ